MPRATKIDVDIPGEAESFAGSTGYATAPPPPTARPSHVPPPSISKPAPPKGDDEAIKAAVLAEMKSQNPALATDSYGILLQEQVAATLQLIRSRQEQAEIARRSQMTDQQWTQHVAEERWGHTTTQRYEVYIKGDKAQPVVQVPANNPEEAQGRYIRLCGIRTTEGEYVITPIHEPNVGDAA